MESALFDLDELMAAAAAEQAWTLTAPAAFTTRYHSPADLDAAAVESGRRRIGRHMWTRASWLPSTLDIEPHGGHSLDLFLADTRPGFVKGEPEHGPGALLTLAVCGRCAWHTIKERENDAAEAWHDHALPDWRSLPIIPAELRGNEQRTRAQEQRYRDWIDDHQPTGWKFAGAPIRSTRGSVVVARHVPGGSPFGGYDLGHVSSS